MDDSWTADPGTQHLAWLDRWTVLGASLIVLVLAVASHDPSGRVYFTAVVVALVFGGTANAVLVRPVSALRLYQESVALEHHHRITNVALDCVTSVHFRRYGGMVVLQTTRPQRWYMISVVGRPRDTLRVALLSAGVMVTGS